MHAKNCCQGLENFQKRHAARMQQLKANGQLLQNSSPQDASEQTKQNEQNDTEIVEPPQKMRKVVIANVEMLVEEGSTITIGGVPVKF